MYQHQLNNAFVSGALIGQMSLLSGWEEWPCFLPVMLASMLCPKHTDPKFHNKHQIHRLDSCAITIVGIF